MDHNMHQGHEVAGVSHDKSVSKDDHAGHKSHQGMISDFRRRFWVSLAVTVPILALSGVVRGFFGVSIGFAGEPYLLFALSSFVFFYGGLPFFRGVLEEFRSKNPGMMTLIAVAITTAYAYSSAVVFGLRGEVFFWEIATLIDIMLFGHWIEMRSVAGASRAIEELARLMPSKAHRIMVDGSLLDVPLGELKVGDRVLVKPGEKLPADGKVVEGETSIDESLLTGESKPVSKKAGDNAIGGSINAEGSITIEVKKTGRDSFISQVITLVKEAQESKSRTQDLANRAARWLTLLALSIGGITFVAWFTVSKDLAFAIERAVTVMVIACPHALGLAVPLVVAVSTSLAAKNGLLIRNRAAFESARKIQAIVFDKTGTLTKGSFGISDVIAFAGMDEKELLGYAASVEAHSEHPIAKAIALSAKPFPVEAFKAIPGKGAEGKVNSKEVKVVSPGYLRENNIRVDDGRIVKVQSQGKTVVFVIIEGKVRGAIALADVIRPESRRAVSMLKEMGIRCMMLTGDNKQVAKWVADELGLDEYFAEVLPQEKASKIREIQSRGLTVAMTGDGVNDAPGLAQADVGIAIGAGTDVAVETADVILVKSNPLDAVAIIGLARATYDKMVQNLLWSTGYNVLAIPLAAGILYNYNILLTPALGALFMSVSTIIVAINAKFLKIR